MTTLTIKEISAAIACLDSALLVLGPPGGGKTTGIPFNLRHHYGYEPVVTHFQMLTTEHVCSVPVHKINDVTKASYLEFLTSDIFLQGTYALPPPPKPIVHVFDEIFKHHDPQIVNAGLAMAQERVFNGHKFRPETKFVFLGNSAEFGVGDQIKPHIVNRLVRVTVGNPSVDDAIQVMTDFSYDGRVISWIRDAAPNALISWDAAAVERQASELGSYWGYNPQRRTDPFCSMRSLQMASNILKTCGDKPFVGALLAGAIGRPAAAALGTFISGLGIYVSPGEVWANPAKAKVPKNMLDQSTVCAGLVAAVMLPQVPAFLTYMARVSPEVRRVATETFARRTDFGTFSFCGKEMTKFLLGEE